MYLVPLGSVRHVQVVVGEDLFAGGDVSLRHHADNETEPGVVYPRESVCLRFDYSPRQKNDC